MKTAQAFKMAFSAIWGNKSRTFLTMLGIIIGVLAVSLLITLGQGGREAIVSQINSLGSDMVVASVMTARDYDVPLDQVQALEEEPLIAAASPVASKSGVTVKANGSDHVTSVEAVLPAYGTIRETGVQAGRFLNEDDVELRRYVALLGADTADELFGSHGAEVLGQSVTMLGRRFVVVGILEEKGASMMSDNDDRILVPLTSGSRAMKQKRPTAYYFKAADSDSVEGAQEVVERFLLSKLKDEDNYMVFNQSQILSVVDSAMDTLTGVLAGIAAISLLVGGIGIMNIMLVSVTERTREIGIRKAIGARRRDILKQFLIESALVSTAGGAIGVGIGYLATKLLENALGIPLSMSLSVIVFSLAFAAAVGIVFGIYPANRAARLHPIEALRHE